MDPQREYSSMFSELVFIGWPLPPPAAAATPPPPAAAVPPPPGVGGCAPLPAPPPAGVVRVVGVVWEGRRKELPRPLLQPPAAEVSGRGEGVADE